MRTWPGSRAFSGSFRPERVFVRTITTPPPTPGGSTPPPTPGGSTPPHTPGGSSLFFLAQPREDGVVLERGRVADRLVAAGDVAQEPAHDLPAACLREGVGEAEIVGAREGADLLGDVLAEGLLQLLRGAVARFERDEGGD